MMESSNWGIDYYGAGVEGGQIDDGLLSVQRARNRESHG